MHQVAATVYLEHTVLTAPSVRNLDCAKIYCCSCLLRRHFSQRLVGPRASDATGLEMAQCNVWNLLRRYRSSIRDDLFGTDVYGVYASDSLANSSFSVPFNANSSSLLLLATGDFSRYVVVPFGNVTVRTTILGSTLNYLFSNSMPLSAHVY